MKGVYKVGGGWQARVYRNKVRRTASFKTEAEAVAAAEAWRKMPIEQFLDEYKTTLQARGVALKQGKYWQAQVTRHGVRRAINCPSEKEALAKVQELRDMPIEEFRALTTNRKTDPRSYRFVITSNCDT